MAMLLTRRRVDSGGAGLGTGGVCLTMAATLGVPAVGRPADPGARILVVPLSVAAPVTPPGPGGASVWLGEASAILLADRLQTLGLAVVSRDERAAAFDRLQLPQISALSRAMVLRVADLIGASEVVFG